MACKKCPHHVRHGQLSKDHSSIEFKDLCGLRVKQSQDPEALAKKQRTRGRPTIEIHKRKPLPKGTPMECSHYPFHEAFDYFNCPVYQETFESKGLRNGVIPTKDFHFSETLAGLSVTDMELL